MSLFPRVTPRSIAFDSLFLISLPLTTHVAFSPTLNTTFTSLPDMLLNTSSGIAVVPFTFTITVVPSDTALIVSTTSVKSEPATVMLRFTSLFPLSLFPLLLLLLLLLLSSGIIVVLTALSTTVPPSFAAGMLTVTVLSADTVYSFPS